MESIICNTGCYQGPHLKKRRILLTCIDLYDKQGILGTDSTTRPRGTCLLVISDIVCAYQKLEVTDERARRTRRKSLTLRTLQALYWPPVVCLEEQIKEYILQKISLKRINVIVYKRWRISCFLSWLLKLSKICHGHYSKINHPRSQSVMRSPTLRQRETDKHTCGWERE